MPHIRPLDPSLVNKIAAGEVIERPASVVKELVENSLDAGATRIDVALEEGGSRLIRVSDDGGGIERDDLPLAVAPHATSKIFSADDLFAIRTMGFRGEALASIASVSHLRIVSRPPAQLEGYEVVCEGGESLERNLQAQPGTLDGSTGAAHLSGQEARMNGGAGGTAAATLIPPRSAWPLTARPCAAPPGTTIEVRHLFYNVPARRKFLRQPQTECSHATEQLARLALAHPHVAFCLTHNGRSLRNLPATGDRRERVADFYGAELAQSLIALDRQERGLRIEALIAPPAHSRASTKWQYLFLNGRYITDRRIGYAIREAFRGLLEHDRFPVTFIFLTADPADVDVNVHPTKIEVRWKDAGLVQSQVLAVLRETLLGHDLTPALRVHRGTEGAATPGAPVGVYERTRLALADYLKRVDPTQPRLAFTPPPFATDRLRPSIRTMLAAPSAPPAGAASPHTSDSGAHERRQASTNDTELDASAGHDGGRAAVAGDRALACSGAETVSKVDADTPVHESVASDAGQAHIAAAFDSAPPVGGVIQIHNTYLVAQTAEGVVIIDQHALHERILYEKFRERILRGPLESQRLLLPETIEAPAARQEAAERHQDLFARIGIELSPFGPGALSVQAFPQLLGSVNISEFVADLLDRLAETDGAASDETLIHAALDMMACKAAIKAGDALSTEEMYALLEQRHLTNRSSNCPHGRPTALELTTRDLERQFKRA